MLLIVEIFKTNFFLSTHSETNCSSLLSVPIISVAVVANVYSVESSAYRHNDFTQSHVISASRTPTPSDVTGRSKSSSRTTTTRATACSPPYHPEGEVSTGASKLSQGHQTVKQPPLTLSVCCQHTDSNL